jgi:hypothetical protein
MVFPFTQNSVGKRGRERVGDQKAPAYTWPSTEFACAPFAFGLEKVILGVLVTVFVDSEVE